MPAGSTLAFASGNNLPVLPLGMVLELYDQNGTSPIASTLTTSTSPTGGWIGLTGLGLTLGATYFVHVDNENQTPTGYQLRVQPAWDGDDR